MKYADFVNHIGKHGVEVLISTSAVVGDYDITFCVLGGNVISTDVSRVCLIYDKQRKETQVFVGGLMAEGEEQNTALDHVVSAITGQAILS